MSQNLSEGREGTSEPGEASSTLPRAELAALLAAERRLSAGLGAPRDVLRFFLHAAEEAADLLKADRAAIFLIDTEEPRLLRIVAGTGKFAEWEGEAIPIEGSFEGGVLHRGAPDRTADLGGDPDRYPSARRTGPAVAVPVLAGRKARGVLLVAKQPGESAFLKRDVEVLGEFARPIGVVLERLTPLDAAMESIRPASSLARLSDGDLPDVAPAAVSAPAGLPLAAADEPNFGPAGWSARYDALLASRDELVFHLDAKGKMEWRGDTESRFGIALSLFAPTLPDLIRRLAPEDADRVRKALRAIAEGRRTAAVTIDCTLVVPGGTPEPRSLLAWRMEQLNEVVGLLGPAVQAAEASVEGSTAEIAESIVRSLRHQINNPLAAVIGRAQLMIREDMVQQEPSLRQAVETILFESERINRFVQQLQTPDGLSRLSEPLPGEIGPKGW